MYWCKSLLSCLERNDFASFVGLTFAHISGPCLCAHSFRPEGKQPYFSRNLHWMFWWWGKFLGYPCTFMFLVNTAHLQIFWPAQCLDSLTVHKVDRQCIFGLDKRPTKVWCKEARHVGCWDDVSQQLSNFHRTAYLDFCWCHGCIFSRGKYMSEKIWNCLSSNLGILKLSVLINQNIFKTVYQNFQKHKSISFKQCWRISSTRIALSLSRRLRCVCRLKLKMPKDFSPYFPHLFGPKLPITRQKILKLSIVYLGFETVCPEKDRQTAF